MCTVIVTQRMNNGTPEIVLAANRDERMDRPSTAPFSWRARRYHMIAPRDEVFGGTWIGMNAHGVAVALTVRDVRTPRKNIRYRSHGLLVLDALAEPTAGSAAIAARREASEYDPIGGRPATHYAPFHLIAVDKDGDAMVAIHDRARANVETIDRTVAFHEPIRHPLIITEQSYGAGRNRRAEWIAKELERIGPNPTDDDLRRVLSVHDDVHPFDGVCVHTTHCGHRYGTRSSTIIAFSPNGAYRYLHAEGPPCTTPYEMVADGNLNSSIPRGLCRGVQDRRGASDSFRAPRHHGGGAREGEPSPRAQRALGSPSRLNDYPNLEHTNALGMPVTPGNGPMHSLSCAHGIARSRSSSRRSR